MMKTRKALFCASLAFAALLAGTASAGGIAEGLKALQSAFKAPVNQTGTPTATQVLTVQSDGSLSFSAASASGFAAQTANTVLAGPTSGGSSAPTFRALVTADLGTTLTPRFAGIGVGVTSPSVGVAILGSVLVTNNSAATQLGQLDNVGDGIGALNVVTTFGGTPPAIRQRRAQGTLASPTAVNGNTLARYQGDGYDGTAFSAGAASITVVAAGASGAWTTGDHGCVFNFQNTIPGTTTTSSGLQVGSSATLTAVGATQIIADSTGSFCFSSTSVSGTADTFLTRASAAVFQLGYTASGTNAAGTNQAIAVSPSTGNVQGGALAFQLAPAVSGGGSGSSANALVAINTLSAVQNNLTSASFSAGALDTIAATFGDGGGAGTGSFCALRIAPTLNYTNGTKAQNFTSLLIQNTHTSAPTGTLNLIDAQLAGTSKFAVSSAGTVSIVGNFATTTTATALQIGGTTASFCALGSDGGTALRFRLADSSGWCAAETGTISIRNSGSSFRAPSNGGFLFASSADGTGTIDTTLNRSSAGVVSVGTSITPNALGSLAFVGAAMTGKVTTYNSVTTAGWGVPAVQATGNFTAQTAAKATVATYTVGAADGTFEVSGAVLVTTSTTHSFSINVDYTDEGNTARTLILPVAQLAGSFVTGGLITNVTGAGTYESSVMHIRCKAATAITISTSSGGTYTTVTFNVNGTIKQTS